MFRFKRVQNLFVARRVSRVPRCGLIEIRRVEAVFCGRKGVARDAGTTVRRKAMVRDFQNSSAGDESNKIKADQIGRPHG